MSHDAVGPRPCIHELDAVRGMALCGILVVNIWQITDMSATVRPGIMDPTRQVLSVLFEGRFLPIFAFLFGLSFALFLDSAAQRTGRPRLVSARRLAALGVLGVLGAVHHVFQPGGALLPYAIVGSVILLPAAGLPRWVLLIAGAAGTVGVALTLGGGLGLVPGLFLLGLAADRFGLADPLRDRGWLLALAFAVSLPAAVVAGRLVAARAQPAHPRRTTRACRHGRYAPAMMTWSQPSFTGSMSGPRCLNPERHKISRCDTARVVPGQRVNTASRVAAVMVRTNAVPRQEWMP
ncbi:hypothetical protein ACFQZZ_22105 [Nocardia sp. GCM10030253]|uniref:hypothetical protein n=1 Tax=Nocardia sp. GCM10030253 TaxID=3273404 RepID=UPI00362680B4